MRRAIYIGLLVIALLIIQGTVFKYIEVAHVKPNLFLITVISYAILRGDVEGAILGLCVGLFQDIFFGKAIGLNALLYMLVGYFAGKPFSNFYFENLIFPITLVLIFSLLYDSVFNFSNNFFKEGYNFSYFFYRIILGSAIYNVIASPLIYKIVFEINNRIENYEKVYEEFFERT